MSAESLSHKVADASSHVQAKSAAAFRAGRIATADGLDAAAAGFNSGGDSVAEFAHSTADTLKASAKYVRKHDGGRMMDDVAEIIREHPGKALLGAVLVGFFAGRALRRD